MTALETAIRIVVDLIVRREYAAAEAVTRGLRLSARDLQRAVEEYGRRVVPPGDGWWSTVELTEIASIPGAFHVAAPLWTAEEGRSDLTVELLVAPSPAVPGIYDVEILDLHVL